MADFDKNIANLEEIVEKLNGGELSLEKSIELYEKGIKLAKTMEKQLDENEKRINIILDGKEQPFDNSEQNAKADELKNGAKKDE